MFVLVKLDKDISGIYDVTNILISLGISYYGLCWFEADLNESHTVRT